MTSTRPEARSEGQRRRRRWLIVYGILCTLVLAELLLQVAAYTKWRGQREELGGSGDGPVVLCVGDSMTHGLGASDAAQLSYPRQLERRLREVDGRAWSVIKAAWPGKNSADVLKKLPDQLRRFRPDVVCILIGVNDFWSRPGLVERPELGDAFRFEWRTGRYLKLLVQSVFGEGGLMQVGDHQNLPFLGRWHHGSTELEFVAGGRLIAGGDELRWVLKDGSLFVVLPAQQQEIEVRYAREGDKLRLESDLASMSVVLEAGPAPAASPLDTGWEAVRNRDWDAAIAAFSAVEAGEDHAVSTHEGLALASAGRGDADGAAEQVAWLERRAAAQPGREVGESLAHARIAIGDVEGAIAAAVAVVGDDPESSRSWEILMTHGMQPAHRPALRGAIDGALGAVTPGSRVHVDLLNLRALLWRDVDPVESLKCHFEALLAGGTEAATAEHIFSDRDLYTTDVLDRCLSRMAPDPGLERELRRTYREAVSGHAGVEAVLAAHLRSMIELCRAAGAEPVLLTYPFEQATHRQLVERVARQEGAGWIAMRPAFEALLEARPWDELFIPDGHCTDAGYAEMARVVADDLRRRVPQ